MPELQDSGRTNTAKPVIITLVIVLLVLVAVIAYMVGSNSAKAPQEGANPNTGTSQSQTPEGSSATAEQPAQQQNEKTEAEAAANKPAPVVPNPQQQKIMAEQVKRDPNDPRARGKVDAPVVMIEYGDFSCPMCARYEFSAADKLQKYVADGTLRIEWRDLSFFRDHHSELAAAGGFAAAEQGKFWEYKRAAYEESAQGGHPDWDPQLIRAVAEKAGVPDLDKFMKTAQDPATLKRVDEETQTAQGIGITSTPFFIINDRFISGAWPYEHFAATIEAAAADAKANK